jgi:hypothetical protein
MRLRWSTNMSVPSVASAAVSRAKWTRPWKPKGLPTSLKAWATVGLPAGGQLSSLVW